MKEVCAFSIKFHLFWDSKRDFNSNEEVAENNLEEYCICCQTNQKLQTVYSIETFDVR